MMKGSNAQIICHLAMLLLVATKEACHRADILIDYCAFLNFAQVWLFNIYPFEIDISIINI